MTQPGGNQRGIQLRPSTRRQSPPSSTRSIQSKRNQQNQLNQLNQSNQSKWKYWKQQSGEPDMEVWQIALYSACAVIAVRMTTKVAMSYRARLRLERAIDILARQNAERKPQAAEQSAAAERSAREREKPASRAA
jgi:hypothetical protein